MSNERAQLPDRAAGRPRGVGRWIGRRRVGLRIPPASERWNDQRRLTDGFASEEAGASIVTVAQSRQTHPITSGAVTRSATSAAITSAKPEPDRVPESARARRRAARFGGKSFPRRVRVGLIVVIAQGLSSKVAGQASVRCSRTVGGRSLAPGDPEAADTMAGSGSDLSPQNDRSTNSAIAWLTAGSSRVPGFGNRKSRRCRSRRSRLARSD